MVQVLCITGAKKKTQGLHDGGSRGAYQYDQEGKLFKGMDTRTALLAHNP